MSPLKLSELLQRSQGVLKLRPVFVHRFYPDFNRLNQEYLKKNARQFIPERWIGSSVEAINPPPIPSGGLSMLDAPGEPLSLGNAIKAAPQEMLGDELLARHGPEFRVLVKLLDPGEPIVFHLHGTDSQVKRRRANFKGHRFGKDEAYYYPEAPKGPQAYTHAGLYEGVTRKELVAAVEKGREHALELSPSFYQEFETGFFVPAGVPHRPGTALTLEIQQPSDVYTLLETHAAGKRMPPGQIHPGFKSLQEAFSLIDFKVAGQVGKLTQNRLIPSVLPGNSRGNEIAWIFPLDICEKFGGKRLRVSTKLTYRETGPFVILIWKGSGMINGRKVRAGEECFVMNGVATAGVEILASQDRPLEAFTFFPG